MSRQKTPQTVPLKQLRASSMPLVSVCAASTGEDEVLVDPFDPTGKTGTDVHRAISMALQDAEYPPFASDDAMKNEQMVQRAVDWFNDNGFDLATSQFELAAQWHLRDGTILSGTIDVFESGKVAKSARVVDWKTGYVDRDYEAQMLAYAWLVLKNDGSLDTVDVHLMFLRLGFEEHKRVSRAYVEAWMDEFIRNTLNHPNVYSPGEHCGRCRRFATCEALSAMNRKTARELLDVGGRGYDGVMLTRDSAADLWPRVRLLEKTIEAYRNYVRESVLRDGSLPLESGRIIGKQLTTKREILPLQAWDTLDDNFTDAEKARFVRIVKGELECVIGDRAAKGMKAKDAKAIMEKLYAAGAIAESESYQVKEMSKQEIEG